MLKLDPSWATQYFFDTKKTA